MENESTMQEALNSSSLSLTPGKHGEQISPFVRTLVTLLVVFCGLLFILCIVLASSGRGSQQCEGLGTLPDDKIWVFAVAHHDVNIAYIDNRTGTISGYNVDVIRAVCRFAEVKCEIVWDVETNCWDSRAGESPKGGPGLFNGWYDGCAGWIPTKARNRTFKFTTPYFRGPSEMLWARKNETTSGRLPVDVTGKNIGFLDGWHSDEFCLLEQKDIVGFNTETSTYVHYQTMQELVQAVLYNQIDYAFCSSHPHLMNVLKPVTSSRVCAIEGPAVMHRKDSRLSDWWNPAFKKLLASGQYRTICEDLKGAHGHMPGGDPSRVCLDGWDSR